MLLYLNSIDLRMLSFLNRKLKYRFLDRTMPVITALGNGGLVWIAISIYLITDGKYQIEGFRIIAALLVTTIVGEGIIKHTIKRTRPFVNMIESKLLISKPITYSFPSGHTASSFAAVGILITSDCKLLIAALLLACLIAFSRVYLNVHYPTDVFMGIILGLLCARIVLMFVDTKLIEHLGLLRFLIS